jgi:AAA ATPase domain
LRYTFFEFENFKGIRKARLDLDSAGSSARVYTLVGLNESGKTTALEAIDHFQGTGEGEISPKELAGWTSPDLHSLIPIADRPNFNGDIVIRCGVELNDDDVAAAAKELLDYDGYRVEDLERELIVTDRYHYENSRFQERSSLWTSFFGSGKTKQGRVERYISHDADNERWNVLTRLYRSRLPTIWYFPNFLFDFPDKIYLETAGDETDANEFYRVLFQDILDALDRDLDVQDHIVNRARSDEPSDRQHLEQVLLEASRHVTETVVRSWNDIFKDESIAQKQVRIDISEDPSDDPFEDAPLWIRFRMEDADGLFAISERSLGFRWFFVYLLITTYRGRRKGASSDLLFLFDEPASNLHQTAQRALLSSFGELSNSAVIIYTTHSHHLIDPVWLPTTFVVTNAGVDPDVVSADFTAQRTDIEITPYRQFAANHPDQSHYFQPILDVLDYSPSDLELIADVAMVEGKTDFYLLSYYQDVVRATPADERLPLMPGGGAGTLDNLIQLYLGWARPFVALLDADRAGKDAVRRYTDKFGPIVQAHLITLDQASGNPKAKGIESLLTENDKLSFQRVIEPAANKYRKKTLHLGIQEALIRRETLALSPTASRALKKTLAVLSDKLEGVRKSTRRS